MKNKFKLFIGISIGVALCAATSFPLTMTVKDYNYPTNVPNKPGIPSTPIQPGNKFEAPVLKDNITFSGSINQLIKTDGRSDDVNNNLNAIFNNNKKAIIKNYDKVNQTDFQSLKITSEILNWNNWGDQTFDQWKQQEQQIEEVVYSDEQNIVFQSKDQLKNYLETNITTILKNKPEAKLAAADFGVNDAGDILIPVTTISTPATARMYSAFSNPESTTTSDKLILKISPNKITFTPQIKISGTYGDNHTQIESKDVSFECKITNVEIKPITFKGDAANKKEVTLKDKGIKDNTIELYDVIKDENIYKALGWLDENSNLGEHLDGSDMDISLLNEEIIYNDLGLNKETDELLGIKLQFINGNESRKVDHEKYNGEYKIIIESIDKTTTDDINLKINNYEIMSSSNQEARQNAPLQVLVPNAYLLDTTLEENKFMYISGSFFGNKSFEMGFKTTNSDNATTLIDNNLKNQKIYKNFMKRIIEAANGKNIKLFNGVTFKYKNTTWNSSMVATYGNVINLDVTLKKGFAFKNNFTLNSSDKTYRYNTTKKSLTTISFGTDCETDVNKGAIWKNFNKTVDQVASGLTE
ncbi:hypothetical protein [Malacoplasma iowae]|uniref:p35 lipoprotein family protein n=1 Tax=Malacoplasma iowae DK-CPA TaxID=1394179 RepID=A0A084U4I5_MALIO|nr:hypothetical protein [Malacoplasma iowae]KFB07871.1 P35 lipoprotein family protein [Malacoplasma iowae DK-CPA]WPL37836.1 hypothetical protein QX182_05025 [Malacoplasma iowae]WPL41227.1 hypothetical protein QX184_01325 [Malacoplasma iowae]